MDTQPPSTKKKILLVEDEVALRDLYHDSLTEAGYLVVTAKDGEEAYTKFITDTYDLMLLDILMPRLSGTQLLFRLKSEDRIKDIPAIVMLTNLSDDMKVAECLQYGAKGYMVKSAYTPDTLVLEIRRYLR
jgi:DNA-binding response OmpR family regulator